MFRFLTLGLVALVLMTANSYGQCNVNRQSSASSAAAVESAAINNQIAQLNAALLAQGRSQSAAASAGGVTVRAPGVLVQVPVGQRIVVPAYQGQGATAASAGSASAAASSAVPAPTVDIAAQIQALQLLALQQQPAATSASASAAGGGCSGGSCGAGGRVSVLGFLARPFRSGTVSRSVAVTRTR